MSEHQDDRDQLAIAFSRKVIVTHKSGVALWAAINYGQKLTSAAVIGGDIHPIHVHFLCNKRDPPKDVMVALLRDLADKLENTGYLNARSLRTTADDLRRPQMDDDFKFPVFRLAKGMARNDIPDLAAAQENVFRRLRERESQARSEPSERAAREPQEPLLEKQD